MGRSATRDRTSRCSRSCFGPSAQLSPTTSGSAWRMLCQNASTVWPESVRPDASTMVPEMISGTCRPSSSKSACTAKMAALALSVSKIVSMSRMSAPPSSRPAAASWYASSSSSQVTLRAAGSPTSGAHRGGAVGGAQGARHEAGPAGLRPLGRVGGVARQAGRGDVQLAHDRGLEEVVGLGDAGRRERVRGDDVGPRLAGRPHGWRAPPPAGSGTAGRGRRAGRGGGRGSARRGSRPR